MPKQQSGLPSRMIDIRGKRYGFLEVISYAGKRMHNGALWRCLCHHCGEHVIVYGRDLRAGKRTRCVENRKKEIVPTRAKNAIIRAMYPLFGSYGVVIGVFRVWGHTYTSNQITEAAGRLGVRAFGFTRGPKKGVQVAVRKERIEVAATQARDAFHKAMMMIPPVNREYLPWEKRFDTQRAHELRMIVMGCSAVK